MENIRKWKRAPIHKCWLFPHRPDISLLVLLTRRSPALPSQGVDLLLLWQWFRRAQFRSKTSNCTHINWRKIYVNASSVLFRFVAGSASSRNEKSSPIHLLHWLYHRCAILAYIFWRAIPHYFWHFRKNFSFSSSNLFGCKTRNKM